MTDVSISGLSNRISHVYILKNEHANQKRKKKERSKNIIGSRARLLAGSSYILNYEKMMSHRILHNYNLMGS